MPPRIVVAGIVAFWFASNRISRFIAICGRVSSRPGRRRSRSNSPTKPSVRNLPGQVEDSSATVSRSGGSPRSTKYHDAHDDVSVHLSLYGLTLEQSGIDAHRFGSRVG